jgi:hypothetical protein
MKKERIMSYQMSQKITKEEMESVSAAGSTNSWTANGTYSNGQFDGCIDVSIDM